MADFGKLVDHPDREEIISKLLTGTEPKEVIEWLELKYPNPDQKHLIINLKLLRDFTKSQYVDIYQQFQNDNKKLKAGGAIDKTLKKIVIGTKSYQELLMEHANKEIDIHEMYREMIIMMKFRISQLFDQVQNNPTMVKPDRAMVEWIRELGSNLERLDRRTNQTPDQIVQHTHSVQYIDQNVSILQDAIREVLAEMSPEIAFSFMDKLNDKLNKVRPPTEQKELTQDNKLLEAQHLKEKIGEIG